MILLLILLINYIIFYTLNTPVSNRNTKFRALHYEYIIYFTLLIKQSQIGSKLLPKVR